MQKCVTVNLFLRDFLMRLEAARCRLSWNADKEKRVEGEGRGQSGGVIFLSRQSEGVPCCIPSAGEEERGKEVFLGVPSSTEMFCLPSFIFQRPARRHAY